MASHAVIRSLLAMKTVEGHVRYRNQYIYHCYFVFIERRPIFYTVVYFETVSNSTRHARAMQCTASNTVDGMGTVLPPSTIVADVRRHEGPYRRRSLRRFAVQLILNSA